MVIRNLHIQRSTRVAQVLTRQDSTLLANQQRSTVRVAAHVIGTDGQVSDLEALDAVHVQALVEYTVLDDRVAVARRHGARAERVPGGFDVACESVSTHTCRLCKKGEDIRLVQSIT